MAAALTTWALAAPALATGDHGGGAARHGNDAHPGASHPGNSHQAPGQQGHGGKGASTVGAGQKQTKGSKGTNGGSQGHGHAHGAKGGKGPKSAPAAPGQVKAKSQGKPASTPGQGGPAKSGSAKSTGHEVVPGNNGTVKIASLGELDGIPDNTPHPGCVFQVEWYGFDGGSDVVSTVSFTPQAPTADAVISVDGPTTVAVGGDAASGAGTGTGLDAVQAYSLSFDGTPHPKQGYHVRLTVSTPHSNGNDTKTKVFWVEPCEPASAAGAAAPAAPEPSEPAEADVPGGITATESATASPSVLGAFAEAGAEPEAQRADEPGAAGEAAVPTSIEAGEDALLPSWARSPLFLALIAAGGFLVALGLVLRQRRA